MRLCKMNKRILLCCFLSLFFDVLTFFLFFKFTNEEMLGCLFLSVFGSVSFLVMFLPLIKNNGRAYLFKLNRITLVCNFIVLVIILSMFLYYKNLNMIIGVNIIGQTVLAYFAAKFCIAKVKKEHKE